MTLAVRVRKRFAASFALDVEFSAPPGVTILFGASGSGKTTLLRCVAGLMTPDAGAVAVDADLVFDDRTSVDVPSWRRRFGFVFQQLALFPHLTAADNIAYGLAHLDAADRRRRAAAIADSFRIGHLLTRRPAEISGGERQRVGLARALVTDPRVLLLDEPLSGLDRIAQSRIIEDLRAWNAAHRIPILYVTHSHREVFALGERVLILQDGRIAADGAPDAVVQQPETDVMAALAGFENVFDTVVEARMDAAGVMRTRACRGAVELEVPLTSAQPGATIRVAIRAGDILVATELPRGLSARNILPGRIASLTQEGSRVRISVDVGLTLEVHVTPTARAALQLQAGTPVWLVIKTHSCRVVYGPV
jgi:molybdate transport system ATP-binding protein